METENETITDQTGKQYKTVTVTGAIDEVERVHKIITKTGLRETSKFYYEGQLTITYLQEVNG